MTTILEDSAHSKDTATKVSALLGGVSDVDNKTLGIAVTDVNDLGTLYFSRNAGDSWIQANQVSLKNALLLDNQDLVYFLPQVDENGAFTDALTFHVWDRSNAEGSGDYVDVSLDNTDASPYSADSDTVSLTVTAVNDHPAMRATTVGGNFTENAPAITLYTNAKASVGPANESDQTLVELTLTV